MRSGFLHVPERRTRVQRCGDERVPQRVRSYVLGDPGMAGCPADDAPGAVTVQPSPVDSDEDGSVAAFADGQVNRTGGGRCERDGDHLATLGGDDQRAVAAFGAQALDVSAGCLRCSQAVQRKQGDQM
jgi:hypothetical protein